MESELRDVLFAHNPLPTLVSDVSARVIDVNDAYLAMTRRTRDEIFGMFSIDFIHADDLGGALAGVAELEAGAPVVRQRRRHRRGDDTWIWLDVITSRVPWGEGHMLLVQVLELGEVTDVTPASEAESRLLLSPFGDGACFHDADGCVRFATANIGDLLGHSPEWFYGRRLTDPEMDPIDPEGRPLGPDDDPAIVGLARGEDVTRTVGLRSVAGERYWYSVRSGPVGTTGLPVRSTLRDITPLVKAQEEARQLAVIVERELSHRADHDSLTGLKARHVITRTLEALVDGEGPVSVVFVDLDGFKAINDELGHVAGDEVLAMVADTLRSLAPDGVTLGRNGGDEFVAVFEDRAVAERFAADLTDQVLTEPPLPPIGASVGIAHRTAGDTPRILLERADSEMYAAKRARRRTA